MRSKTALNILILLVSVLVLFHLGIILKLIPYEITWGGRLKNDSEMYVFEAISIALNLFLLLLLLIKGKFVKEMLSMKIVDVFLWIFLVLFALNTVGNVFAETNVEKLFALLTLSFCALIWIILRKGNQRPRVS